MIYKLLLLISSSLLFTFVNPSENDFSELKLSLQFLNPIDVVAQQDNVLDSLQINSDSVAVILHFTLLDTLNLQFVSCQVLTDSDLLLDSLHINYTDYQYNFDSDFYRYKQDAITNLGNYQYSPDLQVKVQLQYTNRVSPYYTVILDQ